MGEGGRIPWGRLILGVILALGVASALAALVGPLLASAVSGGSSYRLRDDSMAPALITGDWVLAEEIYPGELPRRGDIILYERPGGHGEEGIGRVVGLPGERVQMRGGALYIDGQRAGMERLAERVVPRRPPGRRAPLPLCLNDPVPLDGDCRQEIWRETLPDGTVERVINSHGTIGMAKPSGRASADDTPQVLVPKDHVFVLGDNRDHAIDSRHPQHGPVPLGNVRYRVWLIHTSLDRTSRFFRPRWGRFFQKVE